MTCSVELCEKPVWARGYCVPHYHRWRRHGDPTGGGSYHGDLVGQLLSRIDKHGPVPESAPHLGPCWLWLGTINRAGYGRAWDGARSGRQAHRVVYEQLIGPVPDDLDLDHLCRVRLCVRPSHVEPVTHAENIRRAKEARVSLRAVLTAP